MCGMERREKRAKNDQTYAHSFAYATPLHHAVTVCNTDNIKHLLLQGAQLTHVDANNDTPLHLAAYATAAEVGCLLMSPQGGPSEITKEMHTWKESLYLFVYALKKRNFPREIRLKICKLMLPESNQLISWVPLSSLAFYMQFYSEQEKAHMLELLMRRHIADTFSALDMKNSKGQTPYQLAKKLHGQMRVNPVPVHSLSKHSLVSFKPTIQERYKNLLGPA